MFNIYCINLKKDKQKWQNIQNESLKNNLTINYFPAINGKEYTKEHGKDKLKNFMTPETLNFLSPGAVGCFLSHYSLWLKIINENMEHMLILEDDIHFTPNSHTSLTEIYNNLPPDFDIIFLNCGGICGSNCTNLLGENMCKKIDNIYNEPKFSIGTYAYILSNKGAKNLFKYLFPLNTEFDVKIGSLIQQKTLLAYSLNTPIIYHSQKELSNITNMRKMILTKLGMHYVNLPIYKIQNYTIDAYTLIIIFFSILFAFKFKGDPTSLIILLIIFNWADFIIGYIQRDRANALHNFIDTLIAILIYYSIQNTLLCKS